MVLQAVYESASSRRSRSSHSSTACRTGRGDAERHRSRIRHRCPGPPGILPDSRRTSVGSATVRDPLVRWRTRPQHGLGRASSTNSVTGIEMRCGSLTRSPTTARLSRVAAARSGVSETRSNEPGNTCDLDREFRVQDVDQNPFDDDLSGRQCGQAIGVEVPLADRVCPGPRKGRCPGGTDPHVQLAVGAAWMPVIRRWLNRRA